MTDAARDRAYREIEPVWPFDSGGLLQLLLGAAGVQIEDIWQLVMEDPNAVAWGAVLDADRAPVDWLPWLAQFVGTQLPAGQSEANSRAQIKASPGWQRGTVASMRAAAQRTLTGLQRVDFIERDGGTYKLTVVTYTPETPNAALTLAALVSMKPAGITMTHNVVNGQTYSTVKANYATYTALRAAYATYNLMRIG